MTTFRWSACVAVVSLGCLGTATVGYAQEFGMVSDSGETLALAQPEAGSSSGLSSSFDGAGKLLAAGQSDAALANDKRTVATAQEMLELANARPAPLPGGVGQPESVIAPDGRVRVNPTTGIPARQVALITFKIGAGNYICTGWFINKNTIATAGHCVHPGTKGSAFYVRTTYTIYPGRNGTSSPYGSCTAKQLWTNTAWTGGSGHEYDYAAIKLNCTIGNTVGWFGFWWQTASLNNQTETIQGYPGDKTSGTQWRHADKIWVSTTRKIHYKNDTYGGQSGSPVWRNHSATCTRCSMGIHAYGLSGGYNSGTRINKTVFDFLQLIKAKP